MLVQQAPPQQQGPKTEDLLLLSALAGAGGGCGYYNPGGALLAGALLASAYEQGKGKEQQWPDHTILATLGTPKIAEESLFSDQGYLSVCVSSWDQESVEVYHISQSPVKGGGRGEGRGRH